MACGLGALLGTARYLTLPDATTNDWEHMPLALGLFVIVSGISLGVSVGAATLIAVRRGARVPGLMAAGALGGLLAGVAPGILGIAGFGSRNAPYAGTTNILRSVLVGALVSACGGAAIGAACGLVARMNR